MPKSQRQRRNETPSLAGDLLTFRDELGELHACNAFVLRSLADAMLRGEGLDRRSATGAAFCVQWLDDRAAELEQRLKRIHERAG